MCEFIKPTVDTGLFETDEDFEDLFELDEEEKLLDDSSEFFDEFEDTQPSLSDEFDEEFEIIGRDTRIRVAETTVAPFRYICNLEYDFPKWGRWGMSALSSDREPCSQPDIALPGKSRVACASSQGVAARSNHFRRLKRKPFFCRQGIAVHRPPITASFNSSTRSETQWDIRANAIAARREILLGQVSLPVLSLCHRAS